MRCWLHNICILQTSLAEWLGAQRQRQRVKNLYYHKQVKPNSSIPAIQQTSRNLNKLLTSELEKIQFQ